jgi:hypothetical protein
VKETDGDRRAGNAPCTVPPSNGNDESFGSFETVALHQQRPCFAGLSDSEVALRKKQIPSSSNMFPGVL